MRERFFYERESSLEPAEFRELLVDFTCGDDVSAL
jgi:hypothetical protein